MHVEISSSLVDRWATDGPACGVCASGICFGRALSCVLRPTSFLSYSSFGFFLIACVFFCPAPRVVSLEDIVTVHYSAACLFKDFLANASCCGDRWDATGIDDVEQSSTFFIMLAENVGLGLAYKVTVER